MSFPWLGSASARRWLSLLMGAVLFVAPTSSAERAESDFPRPTMRAVFEQIKILVPLSLSEARWRSPAVQEEVRAALERLERAAAALETHGRAREAGFDALSVNLARELRDTRDRYRRGEFDESRFFFTGTLQTCVSCHVRLPSNREVAFTTELTDRAEFDTLEPRERAWLLVMVRQFDQALATWEAMLRDPEISASRLDAGGVLTDYLNVAIRVRGDLPRASKNLATFAARSDLPLYLERRVSQWRVALATLDAKDFAPRATPSLEMGSRLAAEAGHLAAGPYGRDGLVQDLAAASQLVRWVESDQARRMGSTRDLKDKERRDLAQAYYWLGVVEARSLDGFWVNLSERHLEAAIRIDPKGPLAEDAYALLEETQVLGYGGSSGVHLPTDVSSLLKDLRELMGRER